jgi:cytochrome P450
MFLCLTNNPKYQKMAHEEISRVIGDERLPTLEDKAKCPLIEAIIMETLRLLPTAPFAVPHTSKSHIEFEGYDLPAKSTVS